MTSAALKAPQSQPPEAHSFLGKLNGPWHKRALQVFTIIVVVHLAEHLVQAYQVYVLKWPLHQARGVLGQAFPWLVHSEVLHYGYALIMLVGIWTLLPGFAGRSRTWWVAALVIQFWHHIEHALLQGQVIAGRTLFGAAAPTSIASMAGAATPRAARQPRVSSMDIGRYVILRLVASDRTPARSAKPTAVPPVRTYFLPTCPSG